MQKLILILLLFFISKSNILFAQIVPILAEQPNHFNLNPVAPTLDDLDKKGLLIIPSHRIQWLRTKVPHAPKTTGLNVTYYSQNKHMVGLQYFVDKSGVVENHFLLGKYGYNINNLWLGLKVGFDWFSINQNDLDIRILHDPIIKNRKAIFAGLGIFYYKKKLDLSSYFWGVSVNSIRYLKSSDLGKDTYYVNIIGGSRLNAHLLIAGEAQMGIRGQDRIRTSLRWFPSNDNYFYLGGNISKEIDFNFNKFNWGILLGFDNLEPSELGRGLSIPALNFGISFPSSRLSYISSPSFDFKMTFWFK